MFWQLSRSIHQNDFIMKDCWFVKLQIAMFFRLDDLIQAKAPQKFHSCPCPHLQKCPFCKWTDFEVFCAMLSPRWPAACPDERSALRMWPQSPRRPCSQAESGHHSLQSAQKPPADETREITATICTVFKLMFSFMSLNSLKFNVMSFC